MNKTKFAGLVVIAALMLAGRAQAQLTATLVDSGATPPIPIPSDVYQLATPAAPNFPDGLNYYFDNNPPPGQTFKTGTNADGYALNAVFIRTAGDRGSLPAGGQAYTLRLYSLIGNTAALLVTYVSQTNFTYASSNWVQWSGLGFGLQPNANYAYTFARNTAGWENLANVGGNFYTNGEVVLIPVAGGAITYGGTHNYDASFLVRAIPATALVANPPNIVPSSSVVAGSLATISTTPAVGPGPIGYQWRTDGGSGGSLTNIPGANGVSLPVNTAGYLVGTGYKFDVVVTNLSQAATSSVVTLSVTASVTGSANLYDAGSSFTPWPSSTSQLTGGGNGDGLNYYTDSNPLPGQTFTTGTNFFGYKLASLTIQAAGGTSSGTGTAQGYTLYIYSVTNNQASLVATFTDSSASFTYGNYLTWDSMPTLILNPNSTYAYAFRRNTSGYAGMASSPTNSDLYAGGQICVIPAAGGAITLGNTGLSDAVFSIELLPLGNKTFSDYDEFSDSFWKIINRNNGLPLISSAVGASQTHSATFGIEEEFQVLYNFEDDTYKLRSHDTWQCIEAKNAAASVGTAVVENQNYANAAHQHWRLIDIGGGYYLIANKISGLVLETDNGNPANVTLAAASPNNTRQHWSFSYYYHYPKKGIGQGNPDWRRFGLSWAYDWSKFSYYPTDNLPPHFNYAPMQHRVGWDGLEENMPTDCAPMLTNSKPVFLLGYNEGDRPDQANFPAYEAVANWPYFIAANMPLVSPVTSLGGEWGWLRPFYEGCWSAGYRVDYSAMHWYSSPWAQGLLDHAQWIYDNWGNRVWNTEFCNIAFGFTGTWSEENAYDQLHEYLWRVEDHHPTMRHAWFPQSRDPNNQTWDKWGVNAAMYMADWNTLTPLGEMWGAYDADRTIHTQQPYYLHSKRQSQRLTANPGNATVEHSTIRYGAAAQQIALVDAGSGKYYLQTALDGRRLSYNGSQLAWVPLGTTGGDVEWTVNQYQQGYYWVNNPARSVTLRGRCWRDGYGEPYSIYYDVEAMGGAISDDTQFRFIKPYFGVNLNCDLARYGFEGNATDQSAMNNHGKVSPSGVSFVSGYSGGQAAQFDGTAGYIQVSASVLRQKPWSANTAFSIAFWMKTTQTGGAGSKWTAGAGLVDGDVAGDASDFGLSLVGNKVAFGCGKGRWEGVSERTLLSTVTVNNGQWHHVVATRASDGTMQLFVDGNLQGSAVAGPTENRFSPELLRFGGLLSGSNFYNGALDDVRFLSYVVHSSQVAAMITNAPAPWVAADIGSPGFSGYANVKSGIWTIGGGGSDIWYNWDQFHFLHQPASGDKALITRITALPVTWDGKSVTNSKFGVMFRESTAADAKFVNLTYDHTLGLLLEYRNSTGGNVAAGSVSVPTSSAPFWLKLVRLGNVFTAYRAVTPGTPADNEWIYIDSLTNAMSTNVLAGVAVNAHDNNSICRASLTGLQLATAVLSPGDAWRQEKFGSPANAGDAADSADPDNDTLNNLWERAFGYEPKVANPNAWPFAGIDGSFVTLTYRRSTAATDLTFQAEWTADFTGWSTDEVADSLLTSADGVETRIARVPMNNRDQLFLRLRLTLQP